jgi:hypothetical protein
VTRGATEQHAGEATARAAWERPATNAEKTGWKKRERAGGFAGKPDAFTPTTLPKPALKR